MTDKNQTLKDVLLDPGKYYGDPKEVVLDPRFTTQDHRRILQAWHDNEEALLRAADEGLNGGERPHLRSVSLELQRLDDQTSD